MENWFIYNKQENFNLIKDNKNFTNLQKIILANRDIIDDYKLNTYINIDYNNMHDPLIMKDMKKGVNIFMNSIMNNEHIHIVGDYDQDGVASTIILDKGIRLFYDNLSYSIPDRIEDGYGINKKIVDECIKNDVRLIITCDNGISAIEPIEYAKENGIKVIVTDHHQVIEKNGEQQLPNADAIINPHRYDDDYPFTDICGAVVAFKFIQAIENLYGRQLGIDKKKVHDLIQFAALGTVCDVMKIIDENRIIVIEGLKILNTNPNYGIRTLLNEINWDKEIDIYTIGFLIGPIINASGRLYTARLGVELCLESDINLADEYARTLVELNNKRKNMTSTSLKSSIDDINEEKLYNSDIIVLYNNKIHESICGIVAGRIKELYNKPSIILTDSNEDNIIKGSGRSIESYDMYTNLSVFRDDYVSFGGHKMACGISITKDYLDTFRNNLNNISKLTEDDLRKTIEIDYSLNFNQIDKKIIKQINDLEPYGHGFREPLFASKDVKINSVKILGKNNNVIKFYLSNNGVFHEAISFSIKHILNCLEGKFNIESEDDLYKLEGQCIDIVYKLSINSFIGRETIQLNIVSVR